MTRPTHVLVNLSQLRRNFEAIRAAVAPAVVMPMLKANAYGHGLAGVAPYIARYADYLGVATVEEGIFLRELGIEKPILVTAGTLPEQIPAFGQYGLTLSATSPEMLRAADAYAESVGAPIKTHLEIDTGMERTGMRYYEAQAFLETSLSCKNLEIEGIFTHFANSEDPQLDHAKQQWERFQEVLRFYEKRSLPHPKYRHAANSGAICNFPETYLDMVRPGVMFYGIYPDTDVSRHIPIQPALTWKSRVVYSKITLPGHSVSYSSLWEPDHAVRIVTVPCGYADGYFRRMTNKPQVIVNGKKYQQVGRICMDQLMVNLENDPAGVGDEVILMGSAPGGERIAPEDLAEWAGTNPYEVMTNISARVPRVFVEE